MKSITEIVHDRVLPLTHKELLAMCHSTQPEEQGPSMETEEDTNEQAIR